MVKSGNKHKGKRKIGILGGTFNPPHLGHLILAQEMLDKLHLDKIFFVPTNIPPHKNTHLIDVRHRLAMVRLLIKDNKRFSCLSLEAKRGGVSYSIDTIKALKRKFPHDTFYFIVGSDLVSEFHTWKDYRKIKKIVTVVVAMRDHFPIRKRKGFMFINILQVDISSSLIRGLIKKKFSITYLVHRDVERYINRYKFYR
jgi:nicotinate-nucleotide adenylyltransferase